MPEPTQYEAKDLGEVAAYFETLASDQRAMIGRFRQTQAYKKQCETEARIWDEAAKLVRAVTITTTADLVKASLAIHRSDVPSDADWKSFTVAIAAAGGDVGPG